MPILTLLPWYCPHTKNIIIHKSSRLLELKLSLNDSLSVIGIETFSNVTDQRLPDPGVLFSSVALS